MRREERGHATVFDDLGYSWAGVLGEGMEGVVHRLGGGLVGKVWFNRSAADVLPLRDFYAELSGQGLPFATAEIVAVHDRGGRAVSIERELPGVSLKEMAGAGKVPVGVAQDAVVEVVAALRDTVAGPAARTLPVMGEAASLWAGHETFGRALAALVRRRAGGVHAVLATATDSGSGRQENGAPAEMAGHGEKGSAGSGGMAGVGSGAFESAGPEGVADSRTGSAALRVADFDAMVRRVVELLEELPAGSGRQVVHGDVCLENILVDEAGRPLSLLDWGFLSTQGDNAFDAATAAAFFDMYGPDARVHEQTLLHRLESSLGEPRDRLLLYLAAYAMAGATAYDPNGTDDHFTWCAAILRRDEIRDLLA